LSVRSRTIQLGRQGKIAPAASRRLQKTLLTLVLGKNCPYIAAVKYRLWFGRSPTLGFGSSPGLPSTFF